MSAAPRFVRQYTSPVSGRVFYVFETEDGNRVDVCVRTSRKGLVRYTRREAREIAADRLAGSPAVWYVTCPDWTHGPVTHDEAVRWLEETEALGAKSAAGCHHSHEITKAA